MMTKVQPRECIGDEGGGSEKDNREKGGKGKRKREIRMRRKRIQKKKKSKSTSIQDYFTLLYLLC